jgi:hypothetical protein
MLLAASAGCQRADPLSSIANDSGTEVLVKTALGSDTLLVCVMPSHQDSCKRWTAEVVVDRTSGDMLAVRAEWTADNAVSLKFRGGDIVRLRTRSRSGRVSIQQVADSPSVQLYRPR